ALHPGVVLDTHSGQHRQFLTAQPGHPTSSASDDSRLGRGQPVPAGAEEISHLSSVIHSRQNTPNARKWEELTVRPSTTTTHRLRHGRTGTARMTGDSLFRPPESTLTVESKSFVKETRDDHLADHWSLKRTRSCAGSGRRRTR